MRLIPRSFLWRTILMILIPLIVALTIVANVFFGNHWDRVHATMARGLAGEVATMLDFMDKGDIDATRSMAQRIGINVTVNDRLNRPKHNDRQGKAPDIYRYPNNRWQNSNICDHPV